jgi:hypothetical protein
MAQFFKKRKHAQRRSKVILSEKVYAPGQKLVF